MAEQDASSPQGGLEALRAAAYSGTAAQPSMDMLLGMDPVDPSAKWEAFAAGALKPATGGYGEAMGNALGALSEGRSKEAELRAKYVPLVAQALIQRQMQAAQLAMNQYKLHQEFDQANMAALTSLLSKKGDITGTDVSRALGAVVMRGLSPPEYSKQYLSVLPLGGKPEELRAAIQELSISGLGPKEGFGAVTPKVGMTDSGGTVVPTNTNPTSAAPLGRMGGPDVRPVNKSLTPGEVLGAVGTDKDQAGNLLFTNKLDGSVRYGNSGAPLFGVAGGAPGPGASPEAPGGPGAAPAASPRPKSAPPLRSPGELEYTKEAGKKVAQYQDDLYQSLDAMRNVQQRLTEMKGLVKEFQPGATGELRARVGAWLKDMAATLGLSPEQAESIATSAAKGDVSSAQAFQKLAVQGTLDILKAANPRFTQAEFAVISQNNPNIALDPASLDKMMNFVTKQYQMKSAESQEFSKYIKAGEDPLHWQDTWNRQARELGYVKPKLSTGTAKGSPGKPKEVSLGVSASGKPMRMTEKGWVYDE